jgi:magnesium-transporting ATPase (P-type)
VLSEVKIFIYSLHKKDVICSDITGTLTKNEMTVTRIYGADGSQAEVIKTFLCENINFELIGS